MATLYSEKSDHYYEGTRGFLIDLIPIGPNKLLELGCAKGYSLWAAKESGRASEIVGIDILEPEESHTRLDRYIKNNSDDIDLDFPAGYFDVVLCADVLEHFVNPWQAVRQVCFYLKPGGLLVASIPNIRFYKALLEIAIFGNFGYKGDGGIFDRTHLRFFCKKNMADMFRDAGLEVVSFCYKTSLFYRLVNLITFGAAEELVVRQYAVVLRKPHNS